MPLAVLPAGGCYKWIEFHDARIKTPQIQFICFVMKACRDNLPQNQTREHVNCTFKASVKTSTPSRASAHTSLKKMLYDGR